MNATAAPREPRDWWEVRLRFEDRRVDEDTHDVVWLIPRWDDENVTWSQMLVNRIVQALNKGKKAYILAGLRARFWVEVKKVTL